MRAMFRHPGLLTSEFLAGKRREYTSPLRLYIVVSIAFFILAAWYASRGLLLDPGQSIDAHAGGQAQFLSETLPRLMFVLLPVFALLLKIAYLGRLYFEHLIHALHLHTVAYIVLALMLPLEGMTHWFPISVQIVIFAFLPIYLSISLRRVYATGWSTAVVKTLVLLFAYLIIVSIVVEGASNFRILSD